MHTHVTRSLPIGVEKLSGVFMNVFLTMFVFCQLFDVAGEKIIVTLYGHLEEVYMCVFSHDGKRAASCSEDNTVKVR